MLGFGTSRLFMQTIDYHITSCLLLNYPGPLSSFSSKIELAYAFRLISKNLYDSLNALRKIRNDAAHSSSPFSLKEMSEKVKAIYDLGPNFPIFVKKSAIDMMMSYKIEGMKTILNESDLPEEEKREILEKNLRDQELLDSLKEQLPHWELVVGISFICGLLETQREKIGAVLQGVNTWGSLATKS